MLTQQEQKLLKFRELLASIRSGDAQAARQLVEQFGSHVTRYVRRFRARELRSKFDLEDHVQDVWQSFFRNLHALRCEHPQALLGFLFRLAHNEVIGTNQHFLHSQKSDVHREISLNDPILDQKMLESSVTPPWIRVDWQDEIDGFLRKSPHYLGQEIVRRLHEGYSQKDVARDLHVSAKTVGRVVASIRLSSAPPLGEVAGAPQSPRLPEGGG
jgi:DNA-directed RNA polymerase specialized sigma24 family protein